METEKASPAVELGTQEKRIASILLRFLSEVKEPMQTIDFLSRIVAEDEKGNVPIWNEEGHSNEEDGTLDPCSFHLCDVCGHWAKGRGGRLLSCDAFICNWCNGREMNFGIDGKEGDDVTAKE